MTQTKLDTCRDHGLSEYVKYRGTGWYCRKCMYEQRARKRKELKQKAIEYLGGCCHDCGLTSDIPAVFDFHLIDPEQKDSDISRLVRFSWKKVREELDKCVLLCANCHRTRHYLEENP